MDAWQQLWNAVGALLIVVVAIECVPNLWKYSWRRLRYGPLSKPNYRAEAEAYEGAEWPRRYFVDVFRARLDWVPHLGGKLQPFSSADFNIGTDGLRRTWRPDGAGRGADAVRVFAFGGSTMLGIGVRDDWTVPSLLAMKLSKAGHTVEVTNFGQPAYTFTQSFIAFCLEIGRDNVPGLAVFLDGQNEAIAAEQSGRAGMIFNAAKRAEELNLLQPWRRGDLYRHALRGLFPRTTRRFQDLEEWFRPDSATAPLEVPLTAERIDPLSREVAKDYLATVALARAVAAANGVATLFFWQPSLFGKKRLSAHEARYQNDAAPVPALRAPLFRAVYAAVTSDPAFHANPDAVDLGNLFDDRTEPLFVDPFHPGEKGTDILVDAMLPAVERVLKPVAEP